MAIEIEKKYRLTVEQTGYMEDELAAVTANFIGEEFEENTIYGGGVLDEIAAMIRIRRIGNKTILAFKRRFQNDSDLKHQIEHESEIADPESIAAILAEMKLERRVVYEKRRKTWKFKDVEIVLDELPFGLFMEIEGSITQIKEAEMILGIEDFAVESETYPRLSARLGIDVEGVREARFTSVK